MTTEYKALGRLPRDAVSPTGQVSMVPQPVNAKYARMPSIHNIISAFEGIHLRNILVTNAAFSVQDWADSLQRIGSVCFLARIHM